MTGLEWKDAALHYLQPLKVPFASVAGATGALASVDAMSDLLWIITFQTILVIVILRTILFFEFRVHERKEQRLYTAILTTSQSFDTVAHAFRTDLKDLSGRVGDLEADDDKTAALVDDHERRLKRIEESPLVQRLALNLPTPPR